MPWTGSSSSGRKNVLTSTLSGKAITGRTVRLANLMQRRFGEAFAELGLSDGDDGLLVPLRRAGEPYELTPTVLARTRMITSGGLTPALDRLEKRGVDRTSSKPRRPARVTRAPHASRPRHDRPGHGAARQD